MSLILFDDLVVRTQLLPLTYTRPIGELRVGILTIKEKWEKYLNTTASYQTEAYLATKFPIQLGETNLFVNGSILPNAVIVGAINDLQINEALYQEETLIAAHLTAENSQSFDAKNLEGITKKQTALAFSSITRPYHIFKQNGAEIEADFELITKGRISQPLSPTNRVLGDANKIFIEEGATVEMSIFNTQTGSIYIGKDALIMEGCIVRGPFAMVEHSVLKLGAKIYGPTTLGLYCKVGGEVNNAVFTNYSNKGHDGFLGNAVIGEWCNFGADTNNSNLKNNYALVKLWDYTTERFANTGLQFCGLVMGDHSKFGINTMLNTGTVVGVSCNIYGADFPRNFVPSFSWGSASGYKTYRMNKALETAERMMGRRKVELTQADIDIMQHIFDVSAKFRRWEK